MLSDKSKMQLDRYDTFRIKFKNHIKQHYGMLMDSTCKKKKWDRVTLNQVQDSGFLWKQEEGKWNQGGIQKGLYL